MWWNILDKEGLFMLSLDIGREFMHNCVVSYCFKVNLSKYLEEYKVIHPPSRSILIFIEKIYFAKVSTRNKRDYTLVDLRC
jgi:hypothetical protein